MDDDLGLARINLDGDWDLGTMGEAFRAYTQLYAAAYFLIGSTEPIPMRAAGETGRYSYPWRGGYSVVNLFRSLSTQLPRRLRPEVLEVAYASPGYIELVAACMAVSFVVRTVTVCAHRLLNVYKDVQKEISKRGLNQLEDRERRAHVVFMEAAYAELARTMELPENAKARLKDATHEDPWARLKIALALARRIETVAELTRSQTLSLHEASPLSEIPRESLSEEKQRKIDKLLSSSKHTRQSDRSDLTPDHEDDGNLESIARAAAPPPAIPFAGDDCRRARDQAIYSPGGARRRCAGALVRLEALRWIEKEEARGGRQTLRGSPDAHGEGARGRAQVERQIVVAH